MGRVVLFILSLFFFYQLSYAENGSVVVISIDALHPDAIVKIKPKNIGKLIDIGVSNFNGKSVKPPKTLISHTAMVTGKTPIDSGYNSNVWKAGDPKVSTETVFHDARSAGLKTYYIYSKQKLGFLNNSAIDKSTFGKDDSISIAEKIILNEKKPYFMFLHISGLDEVGPQYGWLSDEYLEEFKFIDNELQKIIDHFIHSKNGTIIITSDHAGHEKEHGTDHPEDYKLPLIIFSKTTNFDDIKTSSYSSYQLRSLVNRVFKKK